MLRKIHPDKCGSAGLEATKRVNEAYDVLKDPDARAAYDLELDAQSEPPKKPKAKPKAKKPAAKPRAASPKRAAPEDDDEPAPKPKRGRKAEAEAPAPAPAPAAEPAAAPAAAPRPWKGSCTCKILAHGFGFSATQRLAHACNAGDVGPHDCACVETRQTRDGTPACRGDRHVCVCNTTMEPNGAYAATAAVGVAGLLVAGPIGLAAGVAAGSLSLTPATSSTHACRAATHECS